MHRLLVTICGLFIVSACGPANRPTPQSDESSSNQSSAATSQFIPNNNQQTQPQCGSVTCQQTMSADIGEPGQPLPMQVNYHYAEGSVSIMIKSTNNPNWQPVQVTPGVQQIQGICDSNGTAIVDIQFSNGSRTYDDSDETRVIGFKEGNSFYVGTDDEGDESLGQKNWQDINDEVLQFSCQNNVTFAFRNLVLNPRIDLQQWLRGDNEGRW